MTEIVMPQLGESVTEGTITQWFKAVGDTVAEDEPLFEVSTDKVDSEVPSPSAGVITEIRVPEGETVDVGTVLVVLGDEGAAPAPSSEPSAEPQADAAPSAPPAPAEPAPQPAPDSAAPADAAANAAPLLSPVVRRLIEENGIDPATISGTGVGGRITREDVLTVVDRQAAAPAAAPAPAAASAAPAAPAAPAPAARPPEPTAPAGEPRPSHDTETHVPLNNIRRITGEHMVRSKAMSPHAVTIVEVDYEAVERARRPVREQFKAEEGHSLTYLPFIARAVIDAIDEYPHMNATVGDGELVVHGSVNLSIAVDLDFDGLLAPVITGAEELRLVAIARDVVDLADRARTRRLAPHEVDGGTFTLTNMGSYGTSVVIPIINQPQVAILSTDGISRKPVVVSGPQGEEMIAIHSVGNLTLAWDHRAFDGAYAAAFMARVKEILETRDWSTEL